MSKILVNVSNWPENYTIQIFRGKEDNKVSRWVSCIKKLNIDCAALVDGDDLAFDYTIYKSKSSGEGFVVEIKDFKIND